MNLNTESEWFESYVLIAIVSVLLIGALSMMAIGGSVTNYDYSVTVTPVDSMDNIDSSEVIEYSSLAEYEKQLVQNALENSGADSESEHFETKVNQKDVVTDNRVVNINGVISYVNVNESLDEVSDQTRQQGFGLFILSILVLISGLASLSDRDPYV